MESRREFGAGAEDTNFLKKKTAKVMRTGDKCGFLMCFYKKNRNFLRKALQRSKVWA